MDQRCCKECKYADWDADGCTCMIDGRLVYNASDYTCDQYRPAKPMTKADRIRQMTDDEELLSAIGTGCYRCAYNNGKCGSKYGEGCGCIEGNLEWLKQEVSEDAGSD